MDKIRKLDDRSQAREKLSIWFGSRDNFYHPIKETIANAADELRNNKQQDPTVKVTLSEHDGELRKITVEDNGRGIPIDGETDGIPNYELLFLTLFAGTKYDVTDRASTGTNGVGNTAICYTSELFEVDSFYNSTHHKIKFVNGGYLDGELTKANYRGIYTGSKFSFVLDKSIYTNTVFEKHLIEEIVQHFAVGALGIKFIFSFEGEEKEFLYESSKQYFEEMISNEATSPIFNLGKVEKVTEVQVVDGGLVEEKNSFDIFIATMPSTVHESYLNMTFLEEGGTINDGILDGVRLFMNKHCRDNKLFPKGVTAFKKEDVESSISFLAITESNNVEFANQTKLSTNKDLYKKQAKEYVESLMEVISIQDQKQFKKMVAHLLEVQKFNSNNDKAKAKLKKQLSEKIEGIGNKIDKFVDCDIHGKDAELFVAEGDSALTSIVEARDSVFQAAHPLKGKILNCLKTDYVTILSNKVIVDLIKILGCGIKGDKKNKDLDSFDIKKLNFGKIIIATDADADGAHIASLIITMIYRLMPDLLSAGLIYIAQTPLYEIKHEDDTMTYFYTDAQKNKELPKIKGKYVISRVKGLGELEPEVMAETAMNKETRNLIKITVEDAEKMIASINDWMGDDVTNRKAFISNNLNKYIDSVI